MKIFGFVEIEEKLVKAESIYELLFQQLTTAVISGYVTVSFVQGHWMDACKCRRGKVFLTSCIAACGAGPTFRATTSFVPSMAATSPSNTRRTKCAWTRTTTLASKHQVRTTFCIFDQNTWRTGYTIYIYFVRKRKMSIKLFTNQFNYSQSFITGRCGAWLNIKMNSCCLLLYFDDVFVAELAFLFVLLLMLLRHFKQI